MYLLEHDAKERLARHGIAIPAGCLVESASAVSTGTLPPGPWVVKGQLAAGGRGKAGLIRKAATLQEVRDHARAILGATVKGQQVASVRVEHHVKAAREVYIGFLLDAASGGVRVVLSANGGMDIEQVPRDLIHSALAPPDAQSLTECVRRLAGDLPFEIAPSVRDAGERLARAFMELEALLIEINPLFVLDGGRWIAGDARIITDDNALPRQKALEALLETRAAAYPDVARKHQHGFDYVVVDPEGEIGLLTTGAGLSMMLIDELRAAGMRPYNFLDIRTGGLRGEIKRLVQVLRWIGDGGRVRVLLVNIFAGITDLGEFSRLLVEAIAAAPQLKVPVVARLVGNGLPAAREVLAAAGIALHTDLDAALNEVRQHLKA
ncbi:MAG: ATP-grasp domain-containing protein [Burkholderiales bacterium]